MQEIRRRTRVMDAVSDVKSALMVAAARLRHIAHIACTQWRRNIPQNGFAAGPRLARDPRGINSDRATAKQKCERSCDRTPLQFQPLVAGGNYPGMQREAGRARHPSTGLFDATLRQQGL